MGSSSCNGRLSSLSLKILGGNMHKKSQFLLVVAAIILLFSCSMKSDGNHSLDEGVIADSEDPTEAEDYLESWITEVAEEEKEPIEENVETVIIGVSRYEYDPELGGYSVSASGSEGELLILSKINGIPVVIIADEAFSGRSDIYGNLIIPDSITSIGEKAFYGCAGLTGDLFISDSVEYLGQSAFEGCCGFDGILYIGKGIKEIPKRAFRYCYGFSGDLLIPENIESIGDEAFFNCFGFSDSLIMPRKDISIGKKAFSYCFGLEGNMTANTDSY